MDMISQDDCPHLKPPIISEEERRAIIDRVDDDQQDAREHGKPSLGAGAIYPVREDVLFCEPFRIPDWWQFAYAIDPGWRVTAALLMARNPDTDKYYGVEEYYGQKDKPIVHAAGILAMLPWQDLEGLIDPAGDNVGNQKDGTKMKEEYEDLDLVLRKANNAVHAGLRRVLRMMQNGQLKLFNTLVQTRKEWRLYRRDKNGKIVKENDHLMDDLRYIMNTDGAFQDRPIPTTHTTGRTGEW